MSDELKLKDEERQPCEVWTRVMGYHRPIDSFNKGKQAEHEERRFFKEKKWKQTPAKAGVFSLTTHNFQQHFDALLIVVTIAY